VSANDFRTLLPKQRRESMRTDDSRAGEVAAAPRHDVAMLCLLALRDEEARNFLQSENWREVLAHVSDAERLVRILVADLVPGDPASLNAFMATLSPAEERLVSGWILQRMPSSGGEMVKKWWLGIRQGILRRQLEAAESRIRLPQQSAGEILNLQKQILDLREQLRELSQLSPARPANVG